MRVHSALHAQAQRWCQEGKKKSFTAPNKNKYKRKKVSAFKYYKGMDNSRSHTHNIIGGNAPQHWSPPEIKQEKKEEGEQPVSQRGDMLDFRDQVQYKSEMENQNLNNCTNNPVKMEESDSPSAASNQQKKEEEKEQPVSQRGDRLDFTDQDHCNSGMKENQNLEVYISNPVKKEESDSPFTIIVKEEKEEEEEQPVSQTGELLHFTDQDHYKSEMEENQNLENCTNYPVKMEESNLPPATTYKQEKEEEIEQPVSQTGELLDFTDQDTENQNQERHTNNPVKTHTAHKKKITEKKGLKQHCCHHCGKAFNSSRYLKIHQKVHTGEELHRCDQCGRNFTQECNLKKHQLIHTREKPFSCDQCGETFTTDGLLKEHQSSHTGEKPYSCEQCGKTFTRAGNLKSHKRIHTGEKPYWCNQCGKTFTRESTLKEHQPSHTGEKPYSCEQCGKTFTRSGNLKSHKRIHTGEKPYCCNQCGKTFTEYSNLKRHQRIHTGEKPHRCLECNKTFTQDGHLKRHQCIHTGSKRRRRSKSFEHDL